MSENIEIRGAREHNLKNIDVDIPINKLTVITGISGSGKSTLAFDTIYAEGQRRYVQSLSAYARQFLGVMDKPKVETIRGLSPAISIEQKSISHNPRSTVGTITEIYDYLRLLYARVGKPHCPQCSKPIKPQDAQVITSHILEKRNEQVVEIYAPVVRGKKGNYTALFEEYIKKGFTRGRVDGDFVEFSDYVGKGKKDLDRYKSHHIDVMVDRVFVFDEEGSRITDSLEQALGLADGLVLLLIRHDLNEDQKEKDANEFDYEEQLFSQHLACADCHINIEKLEPRMFSFNSPFGACDHCQGLGFVQKFDPELIIPNKALTLWEGAILPWRKQVYGWKGDVLESLAEVIGLDLETALKNWSLEHLDIILYGYKKPFQIIKGKHKGFRLEKFEGVMTELERHYKQTDSDARKREIEKFIQKMPCGVCEGSRLSKMSRSVFVDSMNIAELTDLSIKDTFSFFEQIKLNEVEAQIGQEILKEIKTRLGFLINVGLDYLNLSRTAGTLSGGEAQRIRLATQIGSELRGVLYILDEPSIGLHQRDNDKLISTLMGLRDLKNTVIVVEHDDQTMKMADHIIDIGPGAGVHGGEIISSGSPKEVMEDKDSVTGQYLSGKKKIEIPKKRRKPESYIRLTGASGNNLKHVDVDFPIGVFTCVTGVSGSGKSTLVIDTLHKAMSARLHNSKVKPAPHKMVDNLGYVDKVIIIDQTPIGRTPRSNPATYTKVFTDIRELFAMTQEAKLRGYKPGRFSFNVAKGRCSTCEGDGLIKIEMHFLSDVYVQCEQCNGKRYNKETLEVFYKGKTIADILDMTVEESLEFFDAIPKIKKKLQTLYDVGLSYIKLGQSATTLSGGEAQRIKLSAELAKRATGKTFYILDEPTTGLHFQDVSKLLEVLNRLVDKGNSVLVIEHNLDVIKTADYIIDIGPEGGDGGGQVIAKGKPEEIIKVKESYTGKYLRGML